MPTWNLSYFNGAILKILEQLIQSAQIVKRNKDLEQIIEILRVHTKKKEAKISSHFGHYEDIFHIRIF